MSQGTGLRERRMESPSGQGSGDFVEVQVGAVGEGHFEDASKGEIGKPRGSSEQSLLEPVRSELEVRTSAEEEAAWTSYKDIMEDTGGVKSKALDREVVDKLVSDGEQTLPDMTR